MPFCYGKHIFKGRDTQILLEKTKTFQPKICPGDMEAGTLYNAFENDVNHNKLDTSWNVTLRALNYHPFSKWMENSLTINMITLFFATDFASDFVLEKQSFSVRHSSAHLCPW